MCCLAAEAKDPNRVLPLAVFGTISIVTVFYCLASLALVVSQLCGVSVRGVCVGCFTLLSLSLSHPLSVLPSPSPSPSLSSSSHPSSDPSSHPLSHLSHRVCRTTHRSIRTAASPRRSSYGGKGCCVHSMIRHCHCACTLLRYVKMEG